MTLTFDELPWFVRDCILDHALLSKDIQTIFHRIDDDDRYIVQTKPPNATYGALRLVSKSVAAESRRSLLRISPILLEKSKDLLATYEALSSTEIALVRGVVIRAEYNSGNDQLSWEDRWYECIELNYPSIKETFPNLKWLEFDQEPGSVKMNSQVKFETIVKDVITRGVPRYFSNGWGMFASDTNLVGRAYGFMGDRLLAWFQQLIREACEDHIQVNITIRFRCAADPRLQQEEIVGSMSMGDKILVVEHEGVISHLPQVFDTVPSRHSWLM